MKLTDKQFWKFEAIVLACTTVSDYNCYSFHCIVLLCVGLEWYKRTPHKYTSGRRKRLLDAMAGFIPKNTDGSLTSETIFSR